jgi:TRAP-type C4-dicarboxylate transport system permease small subunit
MKLVDSVDRVAGRLCNVLALAACFLLFAMMAVICLDVLLRNVQIPSMPRGFALANDLSEAAIYLMTLFAAPWLLRHGRHIRIDVFLQMLPDRVAWAVEHVADFLVFVCCTFMVWYGVVVTAKSYGSSAMMIKTLVTPEWWLLAPLPVVFLLLSVEVLFRLRRLTAGPIRARDEQVAVS